MSLGMSFQAFGDDDASWVHFDPFLRLAWGCWSQQTCEMIISRLWTNRKLLGDEVSRFRQAKKKEQVVLPFFSLSLSFSRRSTSNNDNDARRKKTHHHSHIWRDKDRRAVILLVLVFLFISLSLGKPTPLEKIRRITIDYTTGDCVIITSSLFRIWSRDEVKYYHADTISQPSKVIWSVSRSKRRNGLKWNGQWFYSLRNPRDTTSE